MSKTESFNFRLSARYKDYLDIFSRRMGLTAGEYLNELIRREAEQHIKDMARIEAEEKIAVEFSVPAYHVQILLNPSPYYSGIDTPAWDQPTLEKVRKRFSELYEISLANWKKELGVKDPLVELRDDVLDRESKS